MVNQYAFFFDASCCTGCKACQVACKDRNNLDGDLIWRRVYEVAGGGWEKRGEVWVPAVIAYNVSMACNHCEKPPCALSCPVKAIGKRDDGLVLIETERCIGCRYCEWACPYSAIRFNAGTNTVSKCHFCFDALDAGEPPACVSACPQRALDFGDLAELRKKYGDVRQIFPLPDPAQAEPALVIKPHRDAAGAAAKGAEVANWEEV
jgi:anaerobic dimethyl sulfoxide reductase subunit B (iron-sulfur subunit)